jgi:hypothetical protein
MPGEDLQGVMTIGAAPHVAHRLCIPSESMQASEARTGGDGGTAVTRCTLHVLRRDHAAATPQSDRGYAAF